MTEQLQEKYQWTDKNDSSNEIPEFIIVDLCIQRSIFPNFQPTFFWK